MPEDEGSELVGLAPMAPPPATSGAAAPVGPPGMPPPPRAEPEPEESLWADDELADFCGDAYAGLVGAVGYTVVGLEEVPEYPESARRRRGKAMALLLRKYGYAEDEIVLLVGFAGGLAEDYSWLKRCKAEEDKRKAAAAPPAAPAPAKAPAPVKSEAGPVELEVPAP